MSRGRLAVVIDARERYDDRAVELARAGHVAGWQVLVLLLSIGSRVDVFDGEDGIRVTRLGCDGTVLSPRAAQLRTLDDRVAVLTARRVVLDRAGEPRRSARRSAVVSALLKAQTSRDLLAAHGETQGDPVAVAAAELARLSGLLREPLLRLKADVVVVAGSCGLAAAAEVAPGRVVYERRPDANPPEPARVAAVAAIEDHVAAQLAAIVDQAPVAHDPIASGAQCLLVPEPVDGVCDWSAVLELATTMVPSRVDDAIPVTGDAIPATADAVPATPNDVPAMAEAIPEASAVPVRLGIAPANFAGQGWGWGRSVERYLDDVSAEVVGDTAGFGFRSDVGVTAELAQDLDWQLGQVRRVLGGWTHALAESVQPVLGQLNGSTLSGDMASLRHVGVRVAVVCHGTDIRRPVHHLGTYPFSPFAADWSDLAAIRLRVDRNRSILHALDIPVFVSTPDLLDDVPHARWLPVVVQEADLEPAPSPFQRDVPVVLHLPSSPRFKGTAVIDAVGQRLMDEGLVEYRSLRDVRAGSVAELVREADIVVDHVVMGNYGVLACQAMAAGRLTVGHVHDRVRRRVGRPVPVLEATPMTLEAVLRSALADPAAAALQAARGPEFVRDLHDGRASARVLASFLGR